MDDQISEILENLDRKLLLLESERKAARRKDIIEGIIYKELDQLKKLLEAS